MLHVREIIKNAVLYRTKDALHCIYTAYNMHTLLVYINTRVDIFYARHSPVLIIDNMPWSAISCGLKMLRGTTMAARDNDFSICRIIRTVLFTQIRSNGTCQDKRCDLKQKEFIEEDGCQESWVEGAQAGDGG